LKAKKIRGADPAGPLGENAARTVKVRLGELRGFAPAALDPVAVTAQHDMRIAAKRLRYVLEATGFCFGAPADPARRRAKHLQDLLGEMHDADVMLPQLREHRAQIREQDADAVVARAGDAGDLDPTLAGRAPHRTDYRGLEVLEVYLVARRRLLFERFRETWDLADERGVWEELERSADRLLER
jgi:CHAD domain